MSKLEQDLAEIRISLARIEKALDIVPDKETKIEDLEESLVAYEDYAKKELNLEEITIENQISVIRSFLKHSRGIINKETVKAYFDSNNSSSWKANQLKALRRYTRDFLKLGNWINDFKFEKARAKIQKGLPTNKELILFFNELPEQEQMVFLILYNSGLREGEVLSLKVGNLDFGTNMIDVSDLHKGQTKSSWISFITSQAAGWLKQYLESN